MSPPEQALNVDFAALAIADPDFARVYTAHDGRIDFQNPQTVQQLTKSILKRDFGLTIELPGDRLCPPVKTSPTRDSNSPKADNARCRSGEHRRRAAGRAAAERAIATNT